MQHDATSHAAFSAGAAGFQYHYLQAVRDQFYIICEGGNLPPPIPNFTDMKFPPAVLGVSGSGVLLPCVSVGLCQCVSGSPVAPPSCMQRKRTT